MGRGSSRDEGRMIYHRDTEDTEGLSCGEAAVISCSRKESNCCGFAAKRKLRSPCPLCLCGETYFCSGQVSRSATAARYRFIAAMWSATVRPGMRLWW